MNHRTHHLNRSLTRITAPSSEPVTLTEAKLYLRVDSTTEDALISDLIVAARMDAEKYLKRSLISQTWQLAYNEYLEREVALQMPPIVSITSVVVTARDGTTQTIDPSTCYLNAAKNKLIFDNSVTGFLIEITYNTGYGAATAIPQPIKYGILSHIAALYDERGLIGQANLPPQVSCLYNPFREVVL